MPTAWLLGKAVLPLIAELEQAPEGSRELDGEIALELGWKKGLGKGYR